MMPIEEVYLEMRLKLIKFKESGQGDKTKVILIPLDITPDRYYIVLDVGGETKEDGMDFVMPPVKYCFV